jgi:hypothetical protein
MITYTLSQRQLKELANRKTLQVALPDPGDLETEAEILDFVRQSLPAVAKSWIVSADLESILVQRADAGSEDVLQEIGLIVRESHEQAEKLRWSVEVVVVTLRATDRPRGTYPVQWPGSYRIG